MFFGGRTKNQKPILAPEQVQEFRHVFNLFDADKSGNISLTELGSAMKSLGMKPTERQLTKMIAEVDKDGSGEIEFFEFVECFTSED